MFSFLSSDSLASSPTRSSSPPLTPVSSSFPYTHYSSPTLNIKQTRDLGTTTRLHGDPDTDDRDDDYLDIFTPEDTRFTFFMVSAERGRWKTDPMPPHSRISKSEPISHPLVSSCSYSSPRSVSEPAPFAEPPITLSPRVQPKPEENVEKPQALEALSPLPLSNRSNSPFLSSSPLSSPVSVNLSLNDSDPPAPVVLRPRENVDSKVRQPIKGAKKKRKKEDRPGSEQTKKKRKMEIKTPSAPLDGDEEIRGMLIESMALSRASSLPVSSLCKSVLQTRPALKAQQSEKEWACTFRRVLDAGREMGLFGMVESSGKVCGVCSLEASAEGEQDEKDRPLEPQWFYVAEMDWDQERAGLVRSLMPRPGKRSETKKYKQYFYRQWDSDDIM